ncbi:hypothetical protein CFOL_v3_15704, partial [Cephalotus follicularis]
ITYIITNNK